MAYDFSKFKQKTKDIDEWLKREYQSIRTGRANTAILDTILVESYGSRVPVNQLANISAEDPRTLRIAPWDNSATKEIERAIVNAGLGLGVVVDDKGLRLTFPELTGERRQALVKLAKEKLEEAKISVRKSREDVLKDLQNKEKDGDHSKDDTTRLKTELQKIIDETNKKLDEAFGKKEKEIIS